MIYTIYECALKVQGKQDLRSIIGRLESMVKERGQICKLPQ